MSWYKTWKRRKLKRSWATQAVHRMNWRASSQLGRTMLMRNAAIVALGMLVLGFLAALVVFAWYAKDLPQPDKIVRRDGFSTKIKDRDDGLLYEIFVDQQRTPITIDQVPEKLKQATIAVEDSNFYAHGGFDPKGIVRAVLVTVFKGSRQGGSTLTQQLVKNVLLTSERKLSRKVKELILSIQIESKYNKDEILQMYLNEAPYGGTAYGVATAANIYFGKQVQDLTLLESAILAGLPQRPSVYSPLSGTPNAYKDRTRHVLRRMRDDGYITTEEEEAANKQLDSFEITGQITSIRAPHFVLHVKSILEDMFGSDLVERGGLQVTTTLDTALHDKAQDIVSDEIAKVADLGIGNGAAVVMDPQTGEVWSMVGSKDFFAKDYDGQVNVALAKRQPGSTIKPLTYATAFAQGYTPSHMLMDVATKFPGSSPSKPYEPVNYDGKFRGPVQLRFALGSSLNIPAVKLLGLVGLEDMMKLGYDMGLVTLEPTKENMQRFGLALTLGGGEVRLIDLTSAYSSFANGGTRIDPVFILKVEDRNGNVLYEHKPVEGPQVLSEQVAFLINHVLADNNARLLTFGANSYLNMGAGVSVKTGTTNEKRDNWTIGWSRAAMVGVWVGNNDNSAMKQVASGVTGASPIWRRIMVSASEKHPATAWTPPDGVEAVQVDVISGYPEHDGFPSRTEYVIKGTLPALPDPIHTKLKLCRDQKALATPVHIERGDFEEKEFIVPKEDVVLGSAPSWQEGIEQWAAAQGDERFKPPTQECSLDDAMIVSIEEPDDKTTIEGNDFTVKVRVVAAGELDRVELYVNDSKKETLVNRPFETNLHLEDGVYELKATARQKDGKEASDVNRIGVGGVAWDTQQTTPTPGLTPTTSPSLSPTP